MHMLPFYTKKFSLCGEDPRSHLFDLSCFTFLHRLGSQEVKVAVPYFTSFVERRHCTPLFKIISTRRVYVKMRVN